MSEPKSYFWAFPPFATFGALNECNMQMMLLLVLTDKPTADIDEELDILNQFYAGLLKHFEGVTPDGEDEPFGKEHAYSCTVDFFCERLLGKPPTLQNSNLFETILFQLAARSPAGPTSLAAAPAWTRGTSTSRATRPVQCPCTPPTPWRLSRTRCPT